MVRQGPAKPSFGGSSPPAASIFLWIFDAGVMELVDIEDLKSSGLRPVPVRVRSPALNYTPPEGCITIASKGGRFLPLTAYNKFFILESVR